VDKLAAVTTRHQLNLQQLVASKVQQLVMITDLVDELS
jgi:hypothetical protein